MLGYAPVRHGVACPHNEPDPVASRARRVGVRQGQRVSAEVTSVREVTPSLRRMLETCTAAVFGEM